VTARPSGIVWTDKEGRKVEAQFCGLSGDFITIQTKDGRTYHFRTDLLIPADVAFARSCLDQGRVSRFSREVIASAAADVDRLVGTVLAANNQRPNSLTTDAQFLRRIYLDAAGRIPTAKEAAAFLDNPAPDKRAQLIDELVFSPGYTMQDVQLDGGPPAREGHLRQRRAGVRFRGLAQGAPRGEHPLGQARLRVC